MRSQSASGFTLVEMMIVIAIIGILAAIAIPAYTDYVAKAQAAEAFSLLAGKKVPMSEFYTDTGRWPTSIADIADIGTRGSFVATVSITDGMGLSTAVTMTAQIRPDRVSSLLRSKRILMTSTNGSSWTCSSPDVPARLLPNACR